VKFSKSVMGGGLAELQIKASIPLFDARTALKDVIMRECRRQGQGLATGRIPAHTVPRVCSGTVCAGIVFTAASVALLSVTRAALP
jgi:hypothetical protein